VGAADIAAVDHPVADRLEVAERRRLLAEGDEVAGEQRAMNRVRFLAHLRGDERSKVGCAQFGPLLVDDRDVGTQFLEVPDKGRFDVAAIGIIGRDRGDGFQYPTSAGYSITSSAAMRSVGGTVMRQCGSMCRRKRFCRSRRIRSRATSSASGRIL